MIKELINYVTSKGKIPFQDWLRLFKKDVKTRSRIIARLQRLEKGHYGDSKHVGKGVFELRLHFGSGYRIYFAEEGMHIILLLCGGDKSTQSEDILKAQRYWQKYKTR